MITVVESEMADGRRARVFFADLPTSPDAARTAVASQFWEDVADVDREMLLRRILGQRNVRATAFPTSGMPGTIQLFLKDEQSGRRIFACVLTTGERLRELLKQRSPLVEGFSLQVMQGERLSMEGIRTGARAWAERCFPGLVLPSITVQRWAAPTGISRDVLGILLSEHKRVLMHSDAAEAPDKELEPDPTIAEPPCEVAA